MSDNEEGEPSMLCDCRKTLAAAAAAAREAEERKLEEIQNKQNLQKNLNSEIQEEVETDNLQKEQSSEIKKVKQIKDSDKKEIKEVTEIGIQTSSVLNKVACIPYITPITTVEIFDKNVTKIDRAVSANLEPITQNTSQKLMQVVRSSEKEAKEQIIQPSSEKVEQFGRSKTDQIFRPTVTFQQVESEEKIEELQGVVRLDRNVDATGEEAILAIKENEKYEIIDKNMFDEVPFEDIGDIEVIDGKEDKKSTFYDAIDPTLVYSNSNLGVLEEGVSFTITGNILVNCERFSVNLVVDNPHRDIALHINPRLPQNYIVRNCRVKKLWGPEEVTSALPFILRRGSKFTIQILLTETQYLISVNGKHFASFLHRLPYQQVTCLEVKGDVENVSMNRVVITEYPSRMPNWQPVKITSIFGLKAVETSDIIAQSKLINPRKNPNEMQMPFYGVFEDPFENGTALSIEGRVKILPHSFFINLQKGQHMWPHPLIAFHFNPRFANTGGRHVICKNSWVEGKWGKEERSELKADFLPGNNFTIKIYCTNTAYEVFLNDKFIAEYKFRIEPKQIDTLYVQGDIRLWEVVLQHGSPSDINF